MAMQLMRGVELTSIERHQIHLFFFFVKSQLIPFNFFDVIRLIK